MPPAALPAASSPAAGFHGRMGLLVGGMTHRRILINLSAQGHFACTEGTRHSTRCMGWVCEHTTAFTKHSICRLCVLMRKPLLGSAHAAPTALHRHLFWHPNAVLYTRCIQAQSTQDWHGTKTAGNSLQASYTYNLAADDSRAAAAATLNVGSSAGRSCHPGAWRPSRQPDVRDCQLLAASCGVAQPQGGPEQEG